MPSLPNYRLRCQDADVAWNLEIVVTPPKIQDGEFRPS